MKMRKFNNQMIDEYLIEHNIRIKRIGDYIKGEKTKFKCLVDGNEWNALAYRIINKENPRGCPKCHKNDKFTISDLILNLEKYNLELADAQEYFVETQILKCKCVWQASVQNILSSTSETGCPYCKFKKETILYYKIKDIIKNYDYLKRHYRITMFNKLRIIDFCLIKDSNVYFIERNGEQHYKPVFFNGMDKNIANENFKLQLTRDREVEDFCKDYDIKLINIKYDMKNEEIENILKSL